MKTMETKKELKDYVENAVYGEVDIQQGKYGYSVIIFTKKEDATIDEFYYEIGDYVPTSIAHGDNFSFSNKNQVAYNNTIDYIFEPEQMNDYIKDLIEEQDESTYVTSNIVKFADSLIKKHKEECEDEYEDAFEMWVKNIEFEKYHEGISKEYVKMLYKWIESEL